MMFASGMCPLWPLHLVLMYLMALIPLWMACCGAASAAASAIHFDPAKVEQLMEGNTTSVRVEFADLAPGEYQFRVDPLDDSGQVTVEPRDIVFRLDQPEDVWRAFNLTGAHLGYTSVRVSGGRVSPPAAPSPAGSASPAGPAVPESGEAELAVSVVRSNRRLDKIFAYSVATLVSLTYVNMGCTLDLAVIKQSLLRPVGPAIGVITQYLVMPLAGFGLAMAFFSDPGLQLGLFLTGCSPGGGASNIWTYLFNGNINLSVTMTFVSALVAFGAVPAWAYSLGRFITDDTSVVIPYRNILTILVSLLVPCGIGLLINRFLPKVADIMRRALKPWSVILFIFIVAFGIYTNMYIWRLLTWKLVLVSAVLPIIGFLGGGLAAWATGRSLEDAIAISIETGIQNTGVTIFMLKFSLPEPSSDLSIVVPIVVATMTPVPLFALLVLRRLRTCLCPPPAPEKAAPPAHLHDSESGRHLVGAVDDDVSMSATV
ncbi:Ileal sodium/bile acid cotransporter [Amphibalanus amphitrite]|uniref:Ileal sodium/bile acid cotransporter n=2 Tax=Amphibalanus amphitrite TaxID=1232801 RepID=A0A6A4VNT6_AMPAM|nr:ileal sodium/bile acid cotransporter-like isoform X1 [Amphibalanus amphitrite]KAF0291918.1 Ileal sodium/bile acid cotransporter [Amphibalanus amphitrite]